MNGLFLMECNVMYVDQQLGIGAYFESDYLAISAV